MNETTHGADLLAATRWVQAGRLTEATAPAATPASRRAGPRLPAIPSRRRHPANGRVIDLMPETLEVTAPRRELPTMKALGTGMGDWPSGGMAPTGPGSHARSTAQLPRALQWQQPRGRAGWADAGWQRRHRTSCRMAPGSLPDPTATRPAAAPISSTCPAPITGRLCRWWSCFTAAPSRPTTSPPARG